MKIILKFTVLTLSLFIIFNCMKPKEKYKIEEINGIKYYKNTGEPTGKYRPRAKFLFELKGPENVPDSMKGFGQILDVIADFNDNIYILDGEHATIKKYSRSGEFERYFPEQSGNGVEQFEKPDQFALLYDTLVVYDAGPGKYLRYLTSGTFIESQYVVSGIKPIAMGSDGKNNLSTFASVVATHDSIKYFVYGLCILDGRFKNQYEIKEVRMPADNDFFLPDILMNYTAKDGIFYITENKSDAYRIFVSDFRGKTKYIIEKEFTKVPYNEYERSQISDFVTASGFPPLDSTKTYYKKAVNTLEIDKNNKLWAQPSLDRTTTNQDSFYIDIFDQGVFINRTVLDFVKGNETYKLKSNRIYVISEDRKSLRVYDYE